MKITMNLPKPERVRADSLSDGDGFIASGGTVFVKISSNPQNLSVKTRLKGFLPKVLVHNVNSACLGWIKNDTMVTPVNLELIVSVKE